MTTRPLSPAAPSDQEDPVLGPHRILRTDSVLSRLPLHQLAKQGRITIHITTQDDQGRCTLHWHVLPHAAFGVPGPLAYKLDTIVINRRLDAQGRPVPQLLRLGSLRALAQELTLQRNTQAVKRALYQNAATFITAKLRYRATDGTVRRLDAGFTRYSVLCAGERLPDGSTADAVYLLLHDPYREVLNHALTRPLDYDYLLALTPMAQRFYELVSFKIFAACKYGQPTAVLGYAEYCLFAPQQRYHTYEQVKKQMYKVHRPHLDAGYLTHVRSEAIRDVSGQPDWLMHYTPGPKALAEFRVFTCQHRAGEGAMEAPRAEERGGPTVQVPTDPLLREAHALVAYFYQRFHGLEHVTPHPKEIAHARNVIAAHGCNRARYLVQFSHQAAAGTRYTPHTFGGILHYTTHAMAAYEHQPQHAATAQTGVCGETVLRERYELYRQHELARLRAALPPEEHAALEHHARVRLLKENTPSFALGLGIRVAVDDALEVRAGLPAFDVWCQQQEADQ
jgi:hypothetical protein